MNRIFNLLWLTPTFFYEKRNIICVKEFAKYPFFFFLFLSGTFLNANIIRNSDTSLAGLVQLKIGKNLFTERFK